jgi:ubiquinone/menaquinone biosynthesis C-methylase UbiE
VTAEAREDTRPAWDKIPPGYDKTVTRTHLWLGNEGLRRAELRADMRFLDVATGNGALSIPAARLGAQVLATDQSPVMLELLRGRARQEPLNIDTRVTDGHALELDDNSFDMAGSQFGVMPVSRHAEGHQRDGARRQAGRPCADDCLRRSRQD